MKANLSEFSINFDQQQPHDARCLSLYENNLRPFHNIESDYNLKKNGTDTTTAFESSAGFVAEFSKCENTQENVNVDESFDDKINKLQYTEKNQLEKKPDHVHFKTPDAVELVDKDCTSMASCEQRETWSKKLDFLMSIIGFSVDIAGIWRFPYLCLKNGGGAFLIPYVIMIVFLGLPLFFLEVALGQYNKSGAITCWKKICPLLSGVGYAVVMIAFYTDFYYNVIIAWGLYYFFSSFTNKLPWSHCGNKWNTKNCYEISTLLHEKQNHNLSKLGTLSNYRNDNYSLVNVSLVKNGVEISSSEEFFYNRMYEISDKLGIDNLGSVLWENVFCLLIVYLICYFSMWKGVKTSGKVVWFTALFPYVVLLILMVQAFFIPGSMNGLKYYITPNMTLLYEPMVWMEAASQVYFALGPGFGVLLAFSSYNNFHNNFYRDSIITVVVNLVSSILSGAVVFMYLGYMSDVTNKTINEVAKDGSSLIFIVYTESISILPFPQFWSCIFFLMVMTLGLDSSFGGSEAIITALSDEYPILRKKREIFIAILFTFYLFIGIPMCTAGGYYIVEFMNNYSVVYSILIAVFIESIAVAWIYGTERICNDIHEMINIYPSIFWRFCWKYFVPCCLLFIFFMGLNAYEPLRIVRTAGSYDYPKWGHIVGWVVGLSASLWIPIIAIYNIYKARGTLIERLKFTLTPVRDQKAAANDIIDKKDFEMTEETKCLAKETNTDFATPNVNSRLTRTVTV